MSLEYIDFDKLIRVARKLTNVGCPPKDNRSVKTDDINKHQVWCDLLNNYCIGQGGEGECPKRIDKEQLVEIFKS